MKDKQDILAVIKSLLLARNEGIIGLRQADRLIKFYDNLYQSHIHTGEAE